MSIFLWTWANRIRRFFGYPARPKRCCRNLANLGPPESHEGRPLSFRRCQVCGCRHFEFAVDPGHLGLRGAPSGG